MMPFLEGYRIGLGMIIFIGPVFFLLLQASFQYGIGAGLAVALGIIISDIVCLLLCCFGGASFGILEAHHFGVGVVGSSILLGIGIQYLSKKKGASAVIPTTALGFKSWSGFLIKGFSVNFFNPFVWVVWIGLYHYGSVTFKGSAVQLVFLGAILLGILTIDVLKVFAAQRLKSILSPKALYYFYKVAGVVLVGFAFRLWYLIC